MSWTPGNKNYLFQVENSTAFFSFTFFSLFYYCLQKLRLLETVRYYSRFQQKANVPDGLPTVYFHGAEMNYSKSLAKYYTGFGEMKKKSFCFFAAEKRDKEEHFFEVQPITLIEERSF